MQENRDHVDEGRNLVDIFFSRRPPNRLSSPPMDSASAPLSTDIATDLPCAICGYNLKGLSPDSNCPECGQAVARTFTADLRHSDPAWLRHQANTMLLLAALCFVNDQPFSYRFGGVAIWMVLAILMAATSVWACWRLSTPEPPGPAADGEATRQRALRLAPIIYAAVIIGSLVSNAFNQTVLGVASMAAMVSLIVTNALVAWFLYRLARRSTDRLLILHARVVLWTFPVSQAGNLLFNLVGLVFFNEGTNREWLYTLFGVIHWLLGLSVYVALLLMGRMHEALRSAARLAEAKAEVIPG